jgi:transcription elongation GreA/GreB family factor
MSKTHYLSQEGFDNLKAELEELKTTGRAEVAAAIAEARERVTYRKMLNTTQQKTLRACWR